MHTQVNELFSQLWQDYVSVTPSAQKIHALLGSSQQDDVQNDHIALRTFNIEKINLEKLAAHFLALGYVECDEYHFEAKKLYAKHFEHPDATQPKVFISELLLEKCSPELQAIVNGLVDQLDAAAVTADNFLYSGRHWAIDQATYETLLAESEYAAWVSVWGFRANHFTVSVNALKNFDTLVSVNDALKAAGFVLNTSGGEIKGSEAVKLVEFTDGSKMIPSCFYEFARRFPLEDGKLYPGFVAASADKIFESTNAR
jgi:hypothetical protein